MTAQKNSYENKIARLEVKFFWKIWIWSTSIQVKSNNRYNSTMKLYQNNLCDTFLLRLCRNYCCLCGFMHKNSSSRLCRKIKIQKDVSWYYFNKKLQLIIIAKFQIKKKLQKDWHEKSQLKDSRVYAETRETSGNDLSLTNVKLQRELEKLKQSMDDAKVNFPGDFFDISAHLSR